MAVLVSRPLEILGTPVHGRLPGIGANVNNSVLCSSYNMVSFIDMNSPRLDPLADNPDIGDSEDKQRQTLCIPPAGWQGYRPNSPSAAAWNASDISSADVVKSRHPRKLAIRLFAKFKYHMHAHDEWA